MLNICRFCLQRQSYLQRSVPDIISKHVLGFHKIQGQTLHSRKPHQSKETSSFSRNRKSKKKQDKKSLDTIFQPIPYTSNGQSDGIGTELTGKLVKEKVLKVLMDFFKRDEVKKCAAENGVSLKLFLQTYRSFKQFCTDFDSLPTDLHILLSDLSAGAGHVDDLMPYFLQHAKQVFPHLECLDDLKNISDLRNPAFLYSDARTMQRKIIFHAGPTNSGKTYHALQSFMKAKTGVYCGPLRLLAAEVYTKCNKEGTPCDLVTGEERRFVHADETPADHVACTVEMSSLTTEYDVAVLDEIQMIRDIDRGSSWTRALLGLCAKEVHLCGEASAIDLVQNLMMDTGDHVEVKFYQRYSQLEYLEESLDSNFDNIQPGDCIVCFAKSDIYYIHGELEKRGIKCAMIYGGLPSGTKLAQAAKFNDPNDPYKVMVATDAIGMGINLSIKRIIFYSIMKPTVNEDGILRQQLISPSLALQIAGRAGRYGTEFEKGQVTTFHKKNLRLLKQICHTPIESIQKAGLAPTAEQIELFAFHLPKATLVNLIDIFVAITQLDNDNYFMCDLEDFKTLASNIEHIPLALHVRYVLCMSPINLKSPFCIALFQKFAQKLCNGEPLTFEWLCRQIGDITEPKTMEDLTNLEEIFDIFDLYLWLRYRFPDMFPHYEAVKSSQEDLDLLIQKGVQNITELLNRSTTKNSQENSEEELSITSVLDMPYSSEYSRQSSIKEKETNSFEHHLIEKHNISKDMLKKLKTEWLKQVDRVKRVKRK